MDNRNLDSLDCFAGVVNVLTNGCCCVFQGQLLRSTEDDRKVYQPLQNNAFTGNDFIALELRCAPRTINDDAQLQEITPALFQRGDIIRIRREDIVAIGPGTSCF